MCQLVSWDNGGRLALTVIQRDLISRIFNPSHFVPWSAHHYTSMQRYIVKTLTS